VGVRRMNSQYSEARVGSDRGKEAPGRLTAAPGECRSNYLGPGNSAHEVRTSTLLQAVIYCTLKLERH